MLRVATASKGTWHLASLVRPNLYEVVETAAWILFSGWLMTDSN
jgi:hypothetical protein